MVTETTTERYLRQIRNAIMLIAIMITASALVSAIEFGIVAAGISHLNSVLSQGLGNIPSGL